VDNLSTTLLSLSQVLRLSWSTEVRVAPSPTSKAQAAPHSYGEETEVNPFMSLPLFSGKPDSRPKLKSSA